MNTLLFDFFGFCFMQSNGETYGQTDAVIILADGGASGGKDDARKALLASMSGT